MLARADEVIEYEFSLSPPIHSAAPGRLTLRNRIVSTPHATGYVTGYLHDEREVYYQAEKAKGCVGLQTGVSA